MGLFKFLFSAKNDSMEEFGVIIDNEFIYNKEKESKKIPKQSISKITLKYGFLSDTVFLKLSEGFILIVFLLFIFHFGEPQNFKFKVLKIVFLIFLAICSGIRAWKKGFFIVIVTDSGVEQINFEEGAKKSRIDNLLNHARNLGYPIFFKTD